MQMDDCSVEENSVGEEEDDEYNYCSRTNSSSSSSSGDSTSSESADESGEDNDSSDPETHSSEDDEDDHSKHRINDKSIDEVAWETCIASGVKIKLPQDLCEHESFFRQLMDYPKIWNECLTDEQRESLSQYLPQLPDYCDNASEQEITIKMLFQRENQRFGVAALDKFRNHLSAGHFRPDIRKMRRLVRKAQQRRSIFEDRKRTYYLAEKLFKSRESLLMDAYNQGHNQPLSNRSMSKLHWKKPRLAKAEENTQIRYMEEMNALQAELGMSNVDDTNSEREDSYLSQISNSKQKKKRKIQSCPFSPQVRTNQFLHGCEDIRPVFSTIDRSECQTNVPFMTREMTEDNYISMLINHKKRKLRRDIHPELNTQGIALSDLSQRAQIGQKSKLVGNSLRISSSKRKIKVEPSVSTSPIPQIIKSPTSPEIENDCLMFLGAPKSSLYQDGKIQPTSNSVPIKIETPEIFEYSQSPKLKTNQTISKIPKISEIKQEIEEYMEIDENLGVIEHQLKSEEIADDNSRDKEDSELHNIDMMEIPLSLDNEIDILEKVKCKNEVVVPAILDQEEVISINDVEDIALNGSGDLMQETHTCFFSLLRDAFTSKNEFRMSTIEVKDAVTLWQGNPISPLNDWYALSASWANLVPSALGFLAGEISYAQDLESQRDRDRELVPYLENKGKEVYAWIGAGRDSDSRLSILCSRFLLHRDSLRSCAINQSINITPVSLKNNPVSQVTTVVNNSNENSMKNNTTMSASPAVESIVNDYGSVTAIIECEPPQPQWPTEWKVRLSTLEEKEEFQRQERLRYAAPHKAFTYRMHGYASVVGPVKGIYQHNVGAGLTKPRGHSLLVPDRPNFVTILALVRDATARLPNGEGTRADICMLLKDSQYIKEQSDQIGNDKDNYLNSVVSGALDRLHYEADPCVRYYPRRKEWLYLHRARSESEFEMYHQQLQGVAKNKKHSGGGSRNKSTQSNQKTLNTTAKELSTGGVFKEVMVKKERKIGTFQTHSIMKKEIQACKLLEEKAEQTTVHIPVEQNFQTTAQTSIPIPIVTASQPISTTPTTSTIDRETVIPLEVKTQPATTTAIKKITTTTNITGKPVTVVKTNASQSLLQSNQHFPHHQIQVSTSAGLQTIRLSGHSVLHSAQSISTSTSTASNSSTGVATIFQNAKIHTQGTLLANQVGKSILQASNVKQQNQQQTQQQHTIPGKTLLASQIKLVSPGQIKSLLGHSLQGQAIFIKQSSASTNQQLKQQQSPTFQTQSQAIQAPGMQRIIAQIGGKPIAVQIQHGTHQQQQQQQQKILAKVLTSAGGGQIISVESLLAQKGLKLAATTNSVAQVNRQGKQVIQTQYQVVPQTQTSAGQTISISSSPQQANSGNQTVRMVTAQLAGKPIVLTTGNKSVGVGISQSGGMVVGKQTGQQTQGQQPIILPSQLLNIKTLHGLKVIPTPAGLKTGAAVYARVIAPTTMSATHSTITQQQNIQTQSSRNTSFAPP